MTLRSGRLLLALGTLAGCTPSPAPERLCTTNAREPPFRQLLSEGWRVQSAAAVAADDRAVAERTFRADGWHSAIVPSTVVGTLVDDGTLPDPYVGTNLRGLAGVDYPIGGGFWAFPMSDHSPYRVAWWYRTEFTVPPAPRDRRVFLRFDGINQRADIYVNGRQIADRARTVGAFRRFEFDVTDAISTCDANVLAVKLRAPEVGELTWNWVDWNPVPPDKNMGLTGAVTLFTSGPILLASPQVVATPDLPALDRAHATVTVEAKNVSPAEVSAEISALVAGRQLARAVTLAAGESRLVTLSDDGGLLIERPRLWWPAHMGAPELYDLTLQARVAGSLSSETALRFGVRKVDSELTAAGHRLFKVNGRNLLIRGAGWAPDMLLRQPRQRMEDEIRYVRDMNLNAIRLEGKLGLEPLLDLTDQYGILVMAGWCCCDQWEMWDAWDDEDRLVSVESLKDQIRRLRNHPSALAWLNASDIAAPPPIEQRYLAVLDDLKWPNPVLASSNSSVTAQGSTGVKQTGPYMWVPPSYWVLDRARGGAFGFNTETSPGAAIPPIESLRRMFTPAQLWPIGEAWTLHSGSATFIDLGVYLRAQDGRMGPSGSAEELAKKAQLMTYEGERAMFEGYGQSKYLATGVIQWMLNNAWPGLIWHLYDYFLRPGGGYFGAKKGCEPLHIQYSYADRNIVVVNSLPDAFRGLTARAEVFQLDGRLRYQNEAKIDLAADGVRVAFPLPAIANLSSTWFLRLTLKDATGVLRSQNFYWLSTRAEPLDDQNATWFYTPVTQYADFTALAGLPKTTLGVTAASRPIGDGEREARVVLTNRGQSLAFFVRVTVQRGDPAAEILPVRWDDNYVSLLPGETRELVARYRDDGAAPVTVRSEGWNVAPQAVELR